MGGGYERKLELASFLMAAGRGVGDVELVGLPFLLGFGT